MNQRVTPAAASGWQLENIVRDLRTARSEWRTEQGRAREPGGRELPSRQIIGEIVEALAGALFPMRLGPPDASGRAAGGSCDAAGRAAGGG